MILICVNNFFKHLFQICDPKDKVIHIYMDGCASLNKLNQQKKRKMFQNFLYLNAHHDDNPDRKQKYQFNRSKISP